MKVLRRFEQMKVSRRFGHTRRRAGIVGFFFRNYAPLRGHRSSTSFRTSIRLLVYSSSFQSF